MALVLFLAIKEIQMFYVQTEENKLVYLLSESVGIFYKIYLKLTVGKVHHSLQCTVLLSFKTFAAHCIILECSFILAPAFII
jgi:hypothetical protein